MGRKVLRRLSVSFPPKLYKELARLARQRDVSVAKVVRQAAFEHAAGRLPATATQAMSSEPATDAEE